MTSRARPATGRITIVAPIMAGEQNHIVCVLRALEPMLGNEDAAEVRTIAGRIGQADSLNAALEDLYAVEGWEAVALRLMWYVECMKASDRSSDDQGLIEERASALYAILLARGNGKPSPPPRAPAPSLPVTLSDGLDAFGRALERLKRSAFDGTAFKGLDRSAVNTVLNEADALRQLAEIERSKDIEQFAESFTRFLGFVLDHGLLGDIRVANFIDNANITLQTASETAGEEDLDSLRQTIELLDNPAMFLE